MFKNSIEEFSAVLEKKRQEYDCDLTDYQADMISWATTMRDALNTAVTDYEESLSTMESGKAEDIGLQRAETNYHRGEYAAWVQALRHYGDTIFRSEAQKEAARLNAMALLTTNLAHNIDEGESA